MKRTLCKDVTLIQQETLEGSSNYKYQLEVENGSYFNVVLTFDFSDSKKVKFVVEKSEEMPNTVFTVVVPPFERNKVVSLEGATGWVINYSLEYMLQFPDKESIRDKMEYEREIIRDRIKIAIKKPVEDTYDNFLVEMMAKEKHFIDFEFLPIDVRETKFRPRIASTKKS